MKIIDADKLHYIRKWFEDSGKSEVVVFAKEIDKAPTVKAIPIERIEKKLNCCDNINAEIFVKALIRDWEEENDFATNSRVGSRSNGDNDSNISSTTNSGIYKESITR